MKKNPDFIFRLCLAVADVLAVTLSFCAAYYFRVVVDTRPYYFDMGLWEFALSMIYLLPIWLLIFAVCGFYRKEVYLYRPVELGRIFIASILGVMSLLTYDYFLGTELFPVRIIVVYALVFCFLALLIERNILRFIRKITLKRGVGVLRALVVGDHFNTNVIIKALDDNLSSGYKVVGVVTSKRIARDFPEINRYEDVATGIRRSHADIIIQTDDIDLENIYDLTVKKHLGYMMVPNHDVMLSKRTSMELLGDIPVFEVKATMLVGYGRFIKRVMDLVLGSIATIVALPFMTIIAIIIKLSCPKAKVLYKSTRLTRYGKKFNFLKFRSMIPKYSDMSPEEAFEKMGKPELIKEYRNNGDQIKNDPRISKFGKFLRRTSLDELPQLFNVLSGQMSLVGPRALVPEELANYPDKELILSVKSGMTGLAQVSGRRSISFEERRVLDVYYIQNWSITMDIKIMFRTVGKVLRSDGAQ